MEPLPPYSDAYFDFIADFKRRTAKWEAELADWQMKTPSAQRAVKLEIELAERRMQTPSAFERLARWIYDCAGFIAEEIEKAKHE